MSEKKSKFRWVDGIPGTFDFSYSFLPQQEKNEPFPPPLNLKVCSVLTCNGRAIFCCIFFADSGNCFSTPAFVCFFFQRNATNSFSHRHNVKEKSLSLSLCLFPFLPHSIFLLLSTLLVFKTFLIFAKRQNVNYWNRFSLFSSENCSRERFCLNETGV